MRVLTKAEQDSLVKVLLYEMDLCKMVVLISLYTGIRFGELCSLRWEDISLQIATMRIRKTMQRIADSSIEASAKTKIIITEPKSRCSVREIPMSSFLIRYIEKFAGDPKAYILSGDSNHFIEPRTLQNRFKSYIKQSNIESAHFHALRHTFTTRCVEADFEP